MTELAEPDTEHSTDGGKTYRFNLAGRLNGLLVYTTQGQSVLASFPIGITGSTGRSTGEHLHITAKYKGKVFNPMAMLQFISKSCNIKQLSEVKTCLYD